ncbi:MAG: glycosyltransferase family 4 protein [Candidatus Brocadiae bacterium]|nr:glycosyltransferase family 4 protein [Candidatus Brocadiia bacterium]
MKLLHLFSNYRWTGPAEPTLNLVGALRATGWDVTFASGRAPALGRDGVLRAAEDRGIPARSGLRLRKHRRLLANLLDARRLAAWLDAERFDLVHANLHNAHAVAAAARARSATRPLLVRTCFAGEGPQGRAEARLLRHHTDGLVVVSERARQHVIEGCAFPADRVWLVHTAIDLARFDPTRIGAAARFERRVQLGIPRDAFVVGIIARIQSHRRYDVFLQAIDLARRQLPNLRAVIVGRGTNMERIAVDPVKRMGLDGVVLLPGYHRGDDYVATVAAMDAKVYLVPGTDGSCRAVRECMAMGVPVIAARRGMLPELVGDHERGLVIDDTPENLADAILAIAADPKRRRDMGDTARQFALRHFDLACQAEDVGEIYRALAAMGPR